MDDQQQQKRKTKSKVFHYAFYSIAVLFVATYRFSSHPRMPALTREWTERRWYVRPPPSPDTHFYLVDRLFENNENRIIRQFPAEPSDVTQLYGTMDSEDTPEMEMPSRQSSQCEQPTDWQLKLYPTCNDVHALDIASDLLPLRNSQILSTKGYWRDAWELNSDNQTMVFKTLKPSHRFEHAYYEHQRIDALVMERLTKSPYVIDMYSYCGLSVLTDYAGKSLSHVVDKLDSVNKLRIAERVAQGVADLHSQGIVHNDLNPSNLAYSESKMVPVLFDFNVAILLKKKVSSTQYCPFVGRYPNPQWRAPEEQEKSSHLTRAVDIYSLGNVFFRFAIGINPWLSDRSAPFQKEWVIESKLRGELPPFNVPNTTDLAIKALLDIMRKCYTFRPHERPRGKQVVRMLHNASSGLLIDTHVNKSNSSDSSVEEKQPKKNAKPNHHGNKSAS